MDLADARALKEQVRRSSRQRFAVGISVTRTPGDHRVAILLEREADTAFAASVASAVGAGIDVEVVGTPRAATSLEPPPPSGPLRIGASVGHQLGGAGSLGFFASRRSDGARGFVSCNHVIALADKGKEGDAVMSPAGRDGGSTVVGRLDGRYPRFGERARADCAFAVLEEGVPHDASAVEGGTLSLERAPVERDLEVTKVGRITGARPGVVSMIEVDDVWIRYGRIHTPFHGVMLVASADGERFCAPGDSGALVYTTRTFRPVGLLFATSVAGGPHDAGWTWVHPVSVVEEALGVELVTH